jgi:hypothetical protein
VLKRRDKEKGAALILVLLLTVVGLIAAAGVLYMAARGGNIFGQGTRYRTAVQAAKGGAEITFQVIGDRGIFTVPLGGTSYVGPNLSAKLTGATGTWPTGADNSVTINPDVPATYDMSFELGDYTVFSKIVDTVPGNSGANTGLLNTGVVNTGSGEVIVVSMPFLYTIEELTQSTVNPSERVKYSILYQY